VLLKQKRKKGVVKVLVLILFLFVASLFVMQQSQIIRKSYVMKGLHRRMEVQRLREREMSVLVS
jgi:hypothetical protein